MKRFAMMLAALFLAAACVFAGVADGTWTAQGQVPAGAISSLVLTSSGATLSGTADGVQITAGKIQNNNLWFTVVKNGKTYACKGQITGSTVTIYQSVSDGSQPISVTLTKN
jgi:hypothetical protein